MDSPLQSNCQPADGSFAEETAESVDDGPKPLLNAGEQYCEPEQHEDKNLYDIPAPFDMDVRAVKHEFIGESSKGNFDELDFLLDEPFQENLDDLQYGNVGFIEASDLSHPVEANTSPVDMLEEFFTFYDANIDNSQDFAYDSLAMLGSEDLIPSQPLLSPEVILLPRFIEFLCSLRTECSNSSYHDRNRKLEESYLLYPVDNLSTTIKLTLHHHLIILTPPNMNQVPQAALFLTTSFYC